MAIDKDKYIKKYIEEGMENVNLVETLIFDIKDGISVEDDLSALLRALHTLKGSSRMLAFKRIEELSHSIESIFTAFREQRIGLSENAVKLILASLDLMKSGFAAIQQTKNDDIEIREYVKNLSLLAANEDFSLPEMIDEQAKYSSVSYEENSLQAGPRTEDTGDKNKKEAKSESIRLSLDKINGIIKSIASLQSLEITAKSILKESDSFNKLLKEYSKLIQDHIKQDLSLTSNLRKLERAGGRLYSSLKNYSIDAGNSISGAYDSVISLRTLPLSTIFDSYPRYVYELSQELGKKVHFTITGKENEIDKNIIEGLSEVFMHMVRNSIDHGIETPRERIAAGKDETGNISISCSRESGNMKIVISDDGRGIDHEKIKQKAIKEGLISEAAAASISDEELTSFIFRSGFSTSGKVSNISGRGVGMDVVRGSIEALKGSIIIESVFGKGTTFTIMVPLSIAVLMGFPIECGGFNFIIPANFVETIMLINREDIITVVDRPEIKYNGRIIKLFYLSNILRINAEADRLRDTNFIVIVRSYEDIAAIAVDNIDSMRSVILKTMPAFMENMPLFSGIILNEDYEIVSVLHIPTVIKMAKRIKTIDMKKRNVEFENLRKSILVVDDSTPTCEIERDILTSEGYLVDTAADGAQALKAMKTKQYDLVCTDINMPVMDGFMLVENVKKNTELSNIPIIVISSKVDEKDQRKAFSLGASRYIIKNSFNNHNLLEAVNELIGGSGVR
ncbi:MAG: response regulator [Spirochaetes bacterium]|nr:response regulator [Spirochaetota bacterium]